MSGTLFVVATPIGNLEDLSPRAVATLEAADCIACEDTRRTARLLGRFGIGTPTVSCHRFNERQRLEGILGRLRAGAKVALVSDGGTPGVSDPGALLVRAALDEGFRICPVPGPSAAATLLSASGLPSDRYVFEGFLPHRAGERRRRLRELRGERRTVVLFESPHRIRDTLADMAEVLGSRTLVLGRELTKIHESILRGSAQELAAALEPEARGEITLAVAPAGPAEADAAGLEERAGRMVSRWREILAEAGGDRRAALRRAARELGLPRDALQRLLAEHGETGE